MTTLDRDRKLLWGRAANRCALCRQELVKDEREKDAASVIGDEAHIVARSPGGPRFRTLAPADLHSYSNLILLCKIHHKQVDDQPNTFTEEALRTAKREHERWVSANLAPAPAVAPIRLRSVPNSPPLTLNHLVNGDQVWEIVVASQAYFLKSPIDGEEEALSTADELLDLIKDYGDISADVVDRGFGAVREVKRQFTDYLERLAEHGYVVFGGREAKILEGGHLPPSMWGEATIVVLTVEQAIEYSAEPAQ